MTVSPLPTAARTHRGRVCRADRSEGAGWLWVGGGRTPVLQYPARPDDREHIRRLLLGLGQLRELRHPRLDLMGGVRCVRLFRWDV
eukprot:SAG22_NODE_563_length_9067_cov_5.039251_4_plen_86_part_00